MTRNVKMMKKLTTFWKEHRKSNLTASWAQSLTEYVADLTSNANFIEQMYDHVAGLLYTTDTAPNQAIVAFPHLANMGSMTSKLRKTYLKPSDEIPLSSILSENQVYLEPSDRQILFDA